MAGAGYFSGSRAVVLDYNHMHFVTKGVLWVDIESPFPVQRPLWLEEWWAFLYVKLAENKRYAGRQAPEHRAHTPQTFTSKPGLTSLQVICHSFWDCGILCQMMRQFLTTLSGAEVTPLLETAHKTSPAPLGQGLCWLCLLMLQSTVGISAKLVGASTLSSVLEACNQARVKFKTPQDVGGLCGTNSLQVSTPCYNKRKDK